MTIQDYGYHTRGKDGTPHAHRSTFLSNLDWSLLLSPVRGRKYVPEDPSETETPRSLKLYCHFSHKILQDVT